MFTIEMLPAEDGDCFWINYGDRADSKNILIDSGTKKTPAIIGKRLGISPGIDILIMTHYDNDHIEGVLGLESIGKNLLDIKDVWFNGWQHVHKVALDKMGPAEAEAFSQRIVNSGWPWNKAFKGGPIFIEEKKALPEVKVGAARLTVLSPTANNLVKLKNDWENRLKDVEPGSGEKGKLPPDMMGSTALSEKTVRKWAENKYSLDTKPANASSICVLIDYEGKKALFAGDANPSVILGSIRKLSKKGEKLKLDFFKVPHHGSKHNLCNELIQAVDCQNYLISTNGKIHNHPDPEAIAKIVVFSTKPAYLWFNYKTKYNIMWEDKKLQKKFNYKTVYGIGGNLKIPR